QFRDGRQAKLYMNTALRISPQRSDRMEVIRGDVRLIVPPRRSWDITAPAANAHPHGTDLHLSVAEDGTTTLTVLEGEVEFEIPQGRVIVKERQESTAQRGQPPSQPKPAVNLPFIIQWANEVQPVALVLEVSYVSQDPARLKAALREAEALPPGPERWRRLGDVRHDLGMLPEALTAYQSAASEARLEGRIGQTWLAMGNVQEAASWFY